MKIKTIFEKFGKKFEKNGKLAYRILENCVGLDKIEEEVVKRLTEALKIKYPKYAEELLQSSNVAILRIIKQGWSLNGNYYTEEALQELPKLIELQGPFQFNNHLLNGGNLDRRNEEMVSYSKYVWYDKETKAIYAVVKFPKGKDTSWILEVIKDAPEMIGISIAAAVYITEDFEKDGKKGDKVDGFAYFDSADYVLFPSAGGQGVEASKVEEDLKRVTEKIEKIKENFSKKTKRLKLRLSEKEKITEIKETIEDKLENIRSFMSRFVAYDAYNTINGAISALNSFLLDLVYYYYDSDMSSDEKIEAIESAFEQCLELIIDLPYLKNPNVEYDDKGNVIKKESINKKENVSMTLKELKEQFNELYLEVINIGKTIGITEEKDKNKVEIEKITKDIEIFKLENVELKKVVDDYKVKETLENRKTLINTKIKESKLPDEAITEIFMETLLSAKDEKAIDKLLEDRKTLVESTKTAIHNEHGGKVDKPISDVIMEKIIKDNK